MSRTLELRPAAEGAFHQLLLARSGLTSRTPCEVDPDPFTSDDHRERTEAAEACAYCPLLEHCREYAELAGEVWHVWAGADRTPRQRKVRAPGVGVLAQHTDPP
jgi:hypothetical protein